MGKKGKNAGGREFWEGLSGWKQVDVGDALLLGSDEYGFCGLEELDAGALGDVMLPGGEAAAEDGPQDGEQQREQKGKKRKQADKAASKAEEEQPAKAARQEGKSKKARAAAAAQQAAEAAGAAPAADGEAQQAQQDESVDALKQQVAALAAENKKLKKSKKREERAERRAAAVVKRKEERAARRAELAAAAAASVKPARQVDVSAWKELRLNPKIEAAISALGFEAPTHVQAECLPAAVRDRRDVIGAAQTGSGKTLAFGLPIMELLLQEREAQQAQQAQQEAGEGEDGGLGEGGEGGQGEREPSKLRALILAPTRELALQVCDHLQAVGKPCGIWAVPIVGGISALKQERLLAKHPEVVVATPGRLWDLMREGHAHLADLSHLSFLVIDEADRMVQQGHYGELSSILGSIPTHQQLEADKGEERLAEDEPEDAPAAAGAAGGHAGGSDDEEEGEEEEEADVEEDGGGGSSDDGGEKEGGDGGSDGEQRQHAAEQGAPQEQQEQRGGGLGRRMQTFVFSATLTLPAKLRQRLRKGGGGASGSTDLDGLMDKIPFRGKPKIVDLTSKRKLADRVEEAYLACGEAERDEYLYCLLAKHPGRTIVFVNAISSVRRLAAILRLLGLSVNSLHAGMQQRQRLRALDRFRDSANAVLVATDVAARGLDIKDVSCVVHYQLPASVDVYVHRSGRTARAEAEGISIAFVTPKENARFLALLRAMKREEPPAFPLDMTLMPAVHKRVRLAVRLDEVERKQSKSRAELSWRRQHAEELGIELSDDSQEEEEVSGRRVGKKAQRDRGGKRGPEDEETAAEVRAQLAALLAEPLQPSFSRKWFTGGAAAAVMASVDPSAPPAASGKKRKQQQRGQQAGGGDGDTKAEAASGAQPKTAQTVTHAVALAQERADSRSKAAAAAAAKSSKQRNAGAAGKQQDAGGAGATQQQQKKKGKKKAGADPRAAALQAALQKAVAAKQRKKAGAGSGRGMLVIPQALGRDAAGPSALQTLRRKLGMQ